MVGPDNFSLYRHTVTPRRRRDRIGQFLLRRTLVVNGTSRHFAATQQSRRIWSEADINHGAIARPRARQRGPRVNETLPYTGETKESAAP